MSGIVAKGKIHDGKIEIDDPIDLPNGSEVTVHVATRNDEDELEDGWDNSPEGIAAWFHWYDSLQPLIFTEQEREAWEADRQSHREWELAHFDERAEKLQRMWQ